MQAPFDASAGRSESSRLPATIGPYRVEREIGRGAAGVVYAVTRDGHQGSYALKLIRDLEGVDPQGLVRFQREAQLSARLQHPGVVGALDAGAHGRHRYLVLPLVQGESLADRLRRESRLPPVDAARLVIEIAKALATVHQAGVVHRDLKPDNILLDTERGGAPRITDFGIAREGFGRGSLTQSSAFLGTPAYMAPEQIQAASQVDGKADVYSLASVLYECVCGAPPFTGLTTFEIADQVLSVEPAPLQEHAGDVPPGVAKACLWALSKDPAARPDALAFAAALQEALAAPETKPSRRPQLALGAAAVALVALVGGGVGAALSSRAAPETSAAEASGSQPVSAPPQLDTERLAQLEARTLEAAPLDSALVRELQRVAEDAGPQAAGPARLVLADYLMRRADLRGALAELKQIPSSSPCLRRATLLRAIVLNRLGASLEALQLESDLVFEDPDDAIGRLVRARRLLGWGRPQDVLGLLQEELEAERVDRFVARTACFSEALSSEQEEALLARAPTESDPDLLLTLAHLRRAQDEEEEASAAEERAEALCAPRDFSLLLQLQILDLQAEVGYESSEDDTEEEQAEQAAEERALREELLELSERAYAAEPNARVGALLLRHGGRSAKERQALFERYRSENPYALSHLLRLGSSPDLPRLELHEVASPFFPGDESWAWARERVSSLPTAARRAGFRALTAAIDGRAPWSYVEAQLQAAQGQDPESGEAARLAAEVCVRRGRVAQALTYLGSRSGRRTARLRARVALYRGHEADARATWRVIAGNSPEGRLAQVELALACGELERARLTLNALEEGGVDLHLARVEVAISAEVWGRGRGRGGRGGPWGRRDEAERKRHEAEEAAERAKRKQILTELEAAQKALGSLDVRIGVARELLESQRLMRLEMAKRWMMGRGGPEGPRMPRPLSRVAYFAGVIDVPASLYLRAVLEKLSRNPTALRWLPNMRGVLSRPIEAALGERQPSPILSTYLALLEEEPEGASSRAIAARQQDSKVLLPNQLLKIVNARFPNLRPHFEAR